MNRQKFPFSLSVEELADGSQYHFQTLTDFVYLRNLPAWESNDAPPPDFPRVPEDLVLVPAGFRTDFASVPGLLLGLLDSDNLVAPAALLHDYLYASGLVSRKDADWIFFEALRENGVPLPLRSLYWAGVRAGGWTKYGARPDEASDLLVALDSALVRNGWRS